MAVGMEVDFRIEVCNLMRPIESIIKLLRLPRLCYPMLSEMMMSKT